MGDHLNGGVQGVLAIGALAAHLEGFKIESGDSLVRLLLTESAIQKRTVRLMLSLPREMLIGAGNLILGVFLMGEAFPGGWASTLEKIDKVSDNAMTERSLEALSKPLSAEEKAFLDSYRQPTPDAQSIRPIPSGGRSKLN